MGGIGSFFGGLKDGAVDAVEGVWEGGKELVTGTAELIEVGITDPQLLADSWDYATTGHVDRVERVIVNKPHANQLISDIQEIGTKGIENIKDEVHDALNSLKSVKGFEYIGGNFPVTSFDDIFDSMGGYCTEIASALSDAVQQMETYQNTEGLEKALANFGMFTTKVSEGFVRFGEMILDCGTMIVGGTVNIFSKGAGDSLKKFAAKDLTSDIELFQNAYDAYEASGSFSRDCAGSQCLVVIGETGGFGAASKALSAIGTAATNHGIVNAATKVATSSAGNAAAVAGISTFGGTSANLAASNPDMSYSEIFGNSSAHAAEAAALAYGMAKLSNAAHENDVKHGRQTVYETIKGKVQSKFGTKVGEPATNNALTAETKANLESQQKLETEIRDINNKLKTGSGELSAEEIKGLNERLNTAQQEYTNLREKIILDEGQLEIEKTNKANLEEELTKTRENLGRDKYKLKYEASELNETEITELQERIKTGEANQTQLTDKINNINNKIKVFEETPKFNSTEKIIEAKEQVNSEKLAQEKLQGQRDELKLENARNEQKIKYDSSEMSETEINETKQKIEANNKEISNIDKQMKLSTEKIDALNKEIEISEKAMQPTREQNIEKFKAEEQKMKTEKSNMKNASDEMKMNEEYKNAEYSDEAIEKQAKVVEEGQGKLNDLEQELNETKIKRAEIKQQLEYESDGLKGKDVRKLNKQEIKATRRINAIDSEIESIEANEAKLNEMQASRDYHNAEKTYNEALERYNTSKAAKLELGENIAADMPELKTGYLTGEGKIMFKGPEVSYTYSAPNQVATDVMAGGMVGLSNRPDVSSKSSMSISQPKVDFVGGKTPVIPTTGTKSVTSPQNMQTETKTPGTTNPVPPQASSNNSGGGSSYSGGGYSQPYYPQTNGGGSTSNVSTTSNPATNETPVKPNVDNTPTTPNPVDNKPTTPKVDSTPIPVDNNPYVPNPGGDTYTPADVPSGGTTTHTGGGYSRTGGYSSNNNYITTPGGTNTITSSAIKGKTAIDDIVKGNKYTKIPTTQTPITTKSSSGLGSVIPIAAGLSAAAAAGIGAKAYLDHKKNNDNDDSDDEFDVEEDNFGAEEWNGDENNLEIDYDDSSDNNTEQYLDDDDDINYDVETEEKYGARTNEELADLQ